MESLSSVSPSIVLPPGNPLRRHYRRLILLPSYSKYEHRGQSLCSLSKPCRRRRRRLEVSCKFSQGEEEEERERDEEELERALRLDGSIPGTSDEFVKQVSSRAYDMRRHLQQTFDSSSYDVLEANPWRETSKPVYVLTHRENQLCTMKTRRNRSSEVERELGKLFSKGGKWKNQAKQSGTGTKFQMLVEDISEGVLECEEKENFLRNLVY